MTRIDQPPAPSTAPQPRKAEDTDTRQALQRHDPEFYRKKDDDEERPGFKDPYEDLADVSVPALKNFLLGLLDRAGAPVATPEPAAPVIDPHHATNPKAAAAASAYQAGAARGATAPPSAMRGASAPPPPPSAPAQQGTSLLDQAAAGLDRGFVLDLIRDLDRLYAEGVTAIALEKGDGFLESVRAGIDRARANAAGV